VLDRLLIQQVDVTGMCEDRAELGEARGRGVDLEEVVEFAGPQVGDRARQ